MQRACGRRAVEDPVVVDDASPHPAVVSNDAVRQRRRARRQWMKRFSPKRGVHAESKSPETSGAGSRQIQPQPERSATKRARPTSIREHFPERLDVFDRRLDEFAELLMKLVKRHVPWLADPTEEDARFPFIDPFDGNGRDGHRIFSEMRPGELEIRAAKFGNALRQ